MDEIAGKDLLLQTSGSPAGNDDASFQNDHALIADSSSSTLTADGSSGPGNVFEQTGIVETEVDKYIGEDIEDMPKLIETSEPEQSRKNLKFNLRKSLAWDSAFFTSDGVLDADELSTMIEGGEKGVKHQLPGIEEEVYRSMDSISTLESDNLSLDCLEAELFQDIRASIQKSNKSSSLSNSNVKASSGKKDSQPKVSNSSKKVDLDSVKRLGTRTKDSTSSIPQPKIINRLNLNATPALTKRASLSANYAKKDLDFAKKAQVTQKGTQTAKPTAIQGPKLTGAIGPRRAVPKPSATSKSSSSGSSTALKTDPARPSSSSSSCSSGADVKVNISRKKVGPKTTKLTTGSIISKTPSRIGTNNKLPAVSSHLSSSISPASSISDWSSESRGSSIDTGVSVKSFDADASVQSSSVQLHPMPRVSSQSGSQTSSLSRPPAAQPTGLRMPSPKIGFFDAGKTGVRTPTGGIRSQMAKTSINEKLGKIPPPKTAAANANMKLNPQRTGPKPAQEKPTSKPKTETCPIDHKSEPSSNICIDSPRNVDQDSNKQPSSGNNASEVLSKVAVTTDGSRTPFAVKNSDSDMEVTEKTVNMSFMGSENSEVI